MNLPSVTVLIAARPGQAEVKAATASRALDYPADKLEVIVARGRQPSAQRNAALKAARGELIYFLDDDSVPGSGNLRRAVPHFNDPAVKMAGGPNLCPPDAPELEQVFAAVLASWLAFGPSRARYTPVGALRETTEKELILCNLVSRREALVQLGGFNEALYPNEENALMDELQKRGGKLIYDPQFFVHRRPRSSLKAFARMLLTYGRGRAEQFRLHPTLGSALNFIPPLFCVYLLFLLPALIWRWLPAAILLAPLAVYALALLGQGLALCARRESRLATFETNQPGRQRTPLRQIFESVAAMPLIILTHVLYGLGFWRGLFTKLEPFSEASSAPVTLETLVH
ncbi:MAG TPA: glycosyltransferase family 2 protein [Verrucomicrobiae bacterium]|nr:glycosyltransferase family 2 protein [Verrucomicrobiae bacterium]